jgi:hypothetical protein
MHEHKTPVEWRRERRGERRERGESERERETG